MNKIELIGIVGSVRHTIVGDARLCNFTLATNYAYRDREGMPIIETTWHNCQHWENKGSSYPEALSKGDIVHVIGRLVSNRYIGADGSERCCFSVCAGSVELVEADSLEIEASDYVKG